MITVTLSIDGAAVTIQQQDDDLKALRAVLELLEDTMERRDLNVRIEELEHTFASLRAELDRTMEHGFDVNAGRDRMIHLRAIEQTAGPLRQRIGELEQELEEAEIEHEVWKAEVFKLGEALGLGDRWTTADALEAIRKPKSIIAGVRSAVEWANSEPVRDTAQRAAIIAHLRRALGDET